MVAQDQQHTAAWLTAANPPPRHAQEDRDQREKQKETDREKACERTLNAAKGEGGREADRQEGGLYVRKEKVAELHRESHTHLKDTGKMMQGENEFMCERDRQRDPADICVCLLLKLKFIQSRIQDPSYFYSQRLQTQTDLDK